MSINKLIHKWQLIVNEIGKGYTMSYEEYTNDISIREKLNREINNSFNANKELLSKIKIIDDRFIDSTKAISNPIVKLTSKPNDIQRFIYFRIPKILIGTLKEDFINRIYE